MFTRNGVCMHTHDVVCDNCRPSFHYWRVRYPDWPRCEDTPTVPNTQTRPNIQFDRCAKGHDFVACNGYVICNVCEKVVKVSE